MRKELEETKESQLYLISFYWAYQTLTTVGFGDYNGNGNSIETIIACFWMILGVLISSYMIGNFISLIQINEQANTEIQSKIFALNSFSKKTRISNALYYKI